jgi:MFS transporter, MHS family, alpha-ketoglutarate permease
LETRTAPAVATIGSAEDNRRRIKAIVASASGNLVEWYDFFVYSFMSVYFASQFFPGGNQTTQLMNSAAIFGAAFFFRPIGGYIFGYIADKHGRKRSMMISIVMMCVGSLMVGLLPTHAQVGILAPIGLLLCRILQGISVGGEYSAAATYMSEVSLPGKRGFFSSFQYVTLIAGQLLAVMILLVLQNFLTEDQLRAFGWRIPFLIGGAAAFVALFLRKSMHETTTAESRNSKDAGSVVQLFKKHPRAVLMVMGFTAGGSLSYYTYTTYMQQYLVNTAGMDKQLVSTVMTVCLFIFMCVQPLFGMLSDKIGRRNSLRIYGFVGMIASVPLLTALGSVTSALSAIFLITTALLIISPYSSISGIVKAEMFPAEVRAMGVGLPYAIANAIFGGGATYAALWFKNAGVESYFYWVVAGMIGVAFIVALVMPDAREKGYLQGHSEVH